MARGLAFRRAQRERWKRRVEGYYGGYMKPQPDAPYRALSPDQRARHIGLSATTRHRCSSYCCGNPRHHFSGAYGGPTMQERRALPVEDA
jgi:hypothetical protein